MTYNTINEAQTIAGNGEGTLLANRYRVVRQLGQGGMGSVWLAEDTQLDNKPFAIKMLPSILVSNKRAYRQLKAEALVAMKLTHPNIVTLRAFEENNGNPFLVMDYIDGQTLDDYLAEHTGTTGVSPVATGLPEADVLRILRPIAAALDYAHSEGVVHRDVKPANVMIRKDGHPYILDFGVAREIQETMTRVTGKLSSGTLMYMSPEQLNGEQPKKEQDVYSFAAMVYECLKGEPPFVRGAIEDQIKNKIPDPLPGNDSLSRGVMAGLAKKPEERPLTCEAVLDGKTHQAASSEKRHFKYKRDVENRKRDVFGGAPTGSKMRLWPFCIVIALMVALGGYFWHQHRGQLSLFANRSVRSDTLKEIDGNVPREGHDFAIKRDSMVIKMKWCPDGDFLMGASEDDPASRWAKQHHVTLTKGFWLGETEVTQRQYRDIMGQDQTVEFLARKAYDENTLFDYEGKKLTFRDIVRRESEGKDITDSDGFIEKFCGDVNDNVPVYFVSWDDASEFCKRLTSQEKQAGRIPDGYEYRLPSEAEWEYACRAGTTIPIPIGRDEEFVKNYVRTNNASALDVIAWWSKNSRMGLKGRGVFMKPNEAHGWPGGKAHAHQVRQKLPNDWGFYDMIGNVREWCYDWYGEYPNKSVKNPQGPSNGTDRVVRGGSWGDDFSCTSGARRWGPPWSKTHFAGFRIALAPTLKQ